MRKRQSVENNNTFNLLKAKGLISTTGKGQIVMTGDLLRVYNFFLAYFDELAEKYKAENQSYPSLISVDTLNKLDFFSSFSHLGTFAIPPKHNKLNDTEEEHIPDIDNRKYILSPAICYHSYQILKGAIIKNPPLVLTSKGKVFRYEGSKLTESPERLWEFTMQEIIFFGTDNDVEKLKNKLMDEVSNTANKLGIRNKIVEATDPFFINAENRGKRLIQRLKKLKFELQTPINKNNKLAIASFNNHEDFFTSRMKIKLENREYAKSGCVAFGIERWAYVFFLEHGVDRIKWPPAVKKLINQYV